MTYTRTIGYRMNKWDNNPKVVDVMTYTIIRLRERFKIVSESIELDFFYEGDSVRKGIQFMKISFEYDI